VRSDETDGGDVDEDDEKADLSIFHLMPVDDVANSWTFKLRDTYGTLAK
jgi:hypothetical protein